MKSEKMSMVDVDKLAVLVEEIKKLKQQKASFFNALEQTGTNEILRDRFLQGKTSEQHLENFNRKLLKLLDMLEGVNDSITESLDQPLPAAQRTVEAELEVPLPSKRVYRSKKHRSAYLKEVGVGEEVIKRLAKPEKISKLAQVDYTVYKTNAYGKLANVFCRPMATMLMNKYSEFFNRLKQSLRMADSKILVKTYVSMMLFTPLLCFIFAFLATIGIGIFFFANKLFLIGTAVAIGLGAGILCFVLFSVYPSLVTGGRNRLMKNDLPFAIIHMAAIAGSGAQPVAMFKLLLNSGEYKGLESEIKKIVNYVNLFGYDLSTALKTVASTTPSKRFKDVLGGIAATIESGGSLKSYLNSMAEDTMNTYKLERKKYVETLSTYSDIYTGILIAAPLLFIVTLAIINVLGGAIAGVGVGTLATIGTYVVIPALNIFFILFLNIVQPE